MDIFLATKNTHKVQELNEISSSHAIQFRGLDSLSTAVEWDETGDSFASNALIKAKAVFDAVGTYVLADDSGLVVPALGGEPGIYTARYAGLNASDEMNYMKLLENMKGIDERDASFVCCLCFLAPNSEPVFFEGTLDGQIAHGPSGEQGFGYDPIFQLEGRDCSLSELSSFEKNLISHRFNAVQKFFHYLDDLNQK